jgi:DNA-binding CsgD family transcriptional regulator
MAQFTGLSERESEVVKLLLEGKSNKLIASSLSISERTVEFHLKNIYNKFQVSSRVELIIKLGESTVASKPGESTVASKGEMAENKDRLNLSNKSKSLRAAVSRIGKELNMNTVMNSNANSEARTSTFFEAILVCLKKYAEFNGRASRAEFWWFTLFVILVGTAFNYMSTIFLSVFLTAMLLPFLAAGSRRLHDGGKSGWWQLFLLVPAAGFFMVGILWTLPSTNPRPDETLPE